MARKLPKLNFQEMDPSQVPEPYNSLLVHDGDMTSRLEAYHESALRVSPLRSSNDGKSYFREVLLTLEESDQGVEYGAIEITLKHGRPEGIDAGWFVKPTIFCDVSNDMRIAQEEIFGPVLVIIPFEDEAEAIEIANDTPYGLAAYLQTGDPARAERVAARLRAGAIHINGGGFNYGSPFGGYKQSGNGREGGMMGLEDYLETKTLHGLG